MSDFEDKAFYHQNFKLCFWSFLYRLSLVLNGGKIFCFLVFVDNIIHD